MSDLIKKIWWHLDKEAVRCSASHSGRECESGYCDEIVNAMSELPKKPSHAECRKYYDKPHLTTIYGNY